MNEKMHELTSPIMKAKLSRDSSHWSLIFLNVNELNAPIKRHRLTYWTQKQNPSFLFRQETHINLSNRHHLRVQGWEKYQSNRPKKEAGTAILIANKIDFNLKSIKKDKEGHSILVTGKIYQE